MKSTAKSATDLLAYRWLGIAKQVLPFMTVVLPKSVSMPLMISVGRDTNPNTRKKIAKLRNRSHFKNTKYDSTPFPNWPAIILIKFFIKYYQGLYLLMLSNKLTLVSKHPLIQTTSIKLKLPLKKLNR